MKEPTQVFKTPGCSQTFVNAESRGYYFSEYTPEATVALGRAASSLKGSERLTLVGDEWRLMRAGRHDIGTYLDVAGAMATDDTRSVIDDVSARVGYVLTSVADPSAILKPQSEASQYATKAVVLSARLPERDRQRVLARDANFRAQFTEARRILEGLVASDSNDVESLIAARARAIRTAAVSGAPTCPTCGPRPEPDALFCSVCSARLVAGTCGQCSAPMEAGSRFCERCGSRAAA
jgi:hypothetical protein